MSAGSGKRSKTTDKRHVCEFCGRGFDWVGDLRIHLQHRKREGRCLRTRSEAQKIAGRKRKKKWKRRKDPERRLVPKLTAEQRAELDKKRKDEGKPTKDEVKEWT